MIYSADGNYQVTIMTKAAVTFDGLVSWNPPAIYKSMCQINVEWFPFDEQECNLKFGSWTYDGLFVELKHKTDATTYDYQTSTGAHIECVEVRIISLHTCLNFIFMIFFRTASI